MVVKCKHCGLQQEVGEQYAGKIVRCSGCSGIVLCRDKNEKKEDPPLGDNVAEDECRTCQNQTQVEDVSGKGLFDGRSTRGEYWAKFFIGLLFAVPLSAVALSAGIAGFIYLCVLFPLFLTLFMWPVSVRRFHDKGMSGWWLVLFWLLSFIPFVGWMVGIIQLVLLGALDGDPWTNQYGPDPKGRNLRCQGNSIVTDSPVPVANASTPEERLQRLIVLKEKCLLTEEEFSQKRQEIISAL